MNENNVCSREFWQLFLQQPFADFTLRFDDGELMVNKAVLAALSRTLSIVLCPLHDCLQLADIRRQTFLHLVEILCQQDNSETPLSEDVAQIVRSLNISIIFKS